MIRKLNYADVADRETVLKAFPNNTKSKKIRAYIYDHSKVRPKEEVAYKYCAKVLLIHQVLGTPEGMENRDSMCLHTIASRAPVAAPTVDSDSDCI